MNTSNSLTKSHTAIFSLIADQKGRAGLEQCNHSHWLAKNESVGRQGLSMSQRFVKCPKAAFESKRGILAAKQIAIQKVKLMNSAGVRKAITNLGPRDDCITASVEGLQMAREQIRRMRDDYAVERRGKLQFHLQTGVFSQKRPKSMSRSPYTRKKHLNRLTV